MARITFRTLERSKNDVGTDVIRFRRDAALRLFGTFMSLGSVLAAFTIPLPAPSHELGVSVPTTWRTDNAIPGRNGATSRMSAVAADPRYLLPPARAARATAASGTMNSRKPSDSWSRQYLARRACR